MKIDGSEKGFPKSKSERYWKQPLAVNDQNHPVTAKRRWMNCSAKWKRLPPLHKSQPSIWATLSFSGWKD